ncbi:hypothetical protein [Nocardia suismassiliense]|uniref:hypothetical protein n=1 Tax=Nocardia suismassiliense TaxID=2077092 RepID=UPI00131F21ED|nr:hypothetical protein [Nocardia suismassiliense]
MSDGDAELAQQWIREAQQAIGDSAWSFWPRRARSPLVRAARLHDAFLTTTHVSLMIAASEAVHEVHATAIGFAASSAATQLETILGRKAIAEKGFFSADVHRRWTPTASHQVRAIAENLSQLGARMRTVARTLQGDPGASATLRHVLARDIANHAGVVDLGSRDIARLITAG